MAPHGTHIGSPAGTTTDVGAIWKAAVDRYEDITKVRLDSLVKAKNVDEILCEIKESKGGFTVHRHDGSKLDKFRTLVSNSLAPIEILGDIVATATKTLYPPTEAIFAAVRYLISVWETANVVSADYDKIEGFFEDLNSYLTRLKVLETEFPPIPELKEALTEVFTSVLVLCGICAKYIRTKRIVKAFRSLAGEDSELKDAYRHFHRMVEREQGIVRNAILAGVERLKIETGAVHNDVKENLSVAEDIRRNTKTTLDDTGQIRKHVETQETALEREKVLNWLSKLEFHTKQRTIFAQHHKGTGNWFLNSDQFQEWFKGGRNSMLWCPGIPGAGKSTMVSAAVNYIEENTQQLDVAITFVYCDYKDPKTHSEIELLSSITRQLAEQSNPMPPEVKAFRDKWTEKRSHPSIDERLSLTKALSRLFDRTFVLVDALDECPEINREKFLCLANELKPFVRLLITSRPHLDLEARVAELSCIEIEAHDTDVRAYLESEISTNNRLSTFTAKDPNLKMQIINSINGRASGMFLLAHLQIGHLCGQSSSKRVLKSLDALATGVYGFYENAITRIEDQPEDDRQLAKRALTYIFCARRPLELEELRHALSVEDGDVELDETALPETHILLNISAGLIRIDEKSNTTGLVHYTLQEYLEKHPEKLLPHPEVEMARACITYLSFDVFERGPCEAGDVLEERLQQYCFLDYAAHNWGNHATHDQLNARMGLLFEFIDNERKVATFLQVLLIPRYRSRGWHDRFPKLFTPLHVAAYWGLDKVLAILCQRGTDIDSQDSYGCSVLQIAAQHGHTPVVRLLLEKGAKAEHRNNRGETALYWGARNGHKEIVELLLANGANIMVEDDEGWTALDWAIMREHEDVVRLLLNHSDDISFKNRGLGKALSLAAEAGNASIIQTLLDKGAEIDWKDDIGNTPITWAVPMGYEKAVRVLLQNGADVNSRDNSDHTPLYWALPFETLARLLIENGANINVRNNRGETPLIWTAQDGQATVMRLLLQHNADVTIQDNNGFTALHAAALKGHEEMVQLLLDTGADPNVKDKDGWTPLHAAALQQQEGVVRILLHEVRDGDEVLEWVASQQKDITARAMMAFTVNEKSEGSSVVSGLRVPAQEGHVERVQALLDTGADINARDLCGVTALTLAAAIGLEDVVRVLIENGADVNKCEKSGRSALHWASSRGDLSIVRLLAENGADADADMYGWRPLFAAAEAGHMSTVQYLVTERGVDVNAADFYGRRVLHWAARYGLSEAAQSLIEVGAEVDAVDSEGKTALIWALEAKEVEAAVTLIQAGANVHVRAQDGSTALDLATGTGDEKMIQLLQGREGDGDVLGTVPLPYRSRHLIDDEDHENDDNAVSGGVDGEDAGKLD